MYAHIINIKNNIVDSSFFHFIFLDPHTAPVAVCLSPYTLLTCRTIQLLVQTMQASAFTKRQSILLTNLIPIQMFELCNEMLHG